MEEEFLHFIKGYLVISLSGEQTERFLNLCAFHGIHFWKLIPIESGYEVCVSLRDYFLLRPYARKSHLFPRIRYRCGLPFLFQKYKKRVFFILGLLFMIAFVSELSMHIWKISFDGNSIITEDHLIKFFYENGIKQGMRKNEIDCKELSAKLRDAFNEFSWVSSEVNGTCLYIHVKEGIPEEDETENEKTGSLQSDYAGIIRSIIVREGRALVHQVEKIEKGALLVSGVIPIVEDSGEIRRFQHVKADADIEIESTLQYYDQINYEEARKQYSGEKRTRWTFQFYNTKLNLPFGKNRALNYDSVEHMYQVKLTDNFYLPIYFTETNRLYYEKKLVKLTKKQVQKRLADNFSYFQEKLARKGVQIFENDVKITWNEKCAIASGTLYVVTHTAKRVNIMETEEELLRNEYG